MKKNFLWSFGIIFFILLNMIACKNDDTPSVSKQEVIFKISPAENISDIKNLSIIFTNVNNQEQKLTFTPEISGGKVKIEVPSGIYNIELKASARRKEDSKEVIVRCYLRNISIEKQKLNLEATLQAEVEGGGFVLSELFIVGSKTPANKEYRQSKYFVIYNNSDKTLYADSLVICETDFMNHIRREDLNPVVLDKAVPVGVVFMVPGKGKDVPVKPGEQIVLADIAKDHSKIQSSYPDLSKADFEWFDDPKKDPSLDEDIPNVPNMEKIYSYSLSVWNPHSKGFRGYIIAKMQLPVKEYLKKYKYDYSYSTIVKGKKIFKKFSRYMIPNDWVIDAVNHTHAQGYVWDVMNKKLDQGFTFINGNKDESKRDLATIRKVLKEENGRKIYQDTNNSTQDFEIKKPSFCK